MANLKVSGIYHSLVYHSDLLLVDFAVATPAPQIRHRFKNHADYDDEADGNKAGQWVIPAYFREQLKCSITKIEHVDDAL